MTNMHIKWFGSLLLGVIVLSGCFSSCSLNRQANSLNALRHCEFSLVGVESLSVAGTDIRHLVKSGNVDLPRLPGMALAFLSGELPLHSVVKMKVTNPTKYTAGIKQFKYEVLMDGREVIDGTSDLPIEVGPNRSDTVLVDIRANAYQLLNDREARNKIMALLDNNNAGNQAGSAQNPRIHLTLRIKPTIDLGNQSIDYPGYITIDRIVDRSILSRF